MEKLKETVNRTVDIIGRILFGIVFLCGVVFVADQTNALIQKSYADTEITLPETNGLNSSVSYKYERVYINGKYYLVFSNMTCSDIEVVPIEW
jgi:hypothetical protein